MSSTKPKENRWVIATGNKGKLKEFRRLFADTGIEILAQTELGVTEAEENGLSFIENSILKARNASGQTGLPAIADDSGLEVAALNGEPGIYSARYSSDIAGDACNDATNNKKLLDRLQGVDDRSARFVCALSFVRHVKDPTPIVAVAYWKGRILQEPRGTAGFGYDPLFYIESHACTSAELAPDVKNRISHRGQALSEFIRMLDVKGG